MFRISALRNGLVLAALMTLYGSAYVVVCGSKGTRCFAVRNCETFSHVPAAGDRFQRMIIQPRTLSE
jgi:hypothetical protein